MYEQHFIKDESVTVQAMIDQAIAKVGEKISVRRFVRMKVGDVLATYASGILAEAEMPMAFRRTPRKSDDAGDSAAAPAKA